MTGDEVVRRLRAFEKGRPLPNGETLRIPRLMDDQVLVLAFVKMGGESSPWGIAWGHPGKIPQLLTVAEPRTRDDVAEMMARFSPFLLSHLAHPQHSRFGPDPDAKLPPFQVWLPNDSHLEMLHHLAYSYTFTKFGDTSRIARLQALGRACGWLFRESQRPGQLSVITATRALTETYTFPAETTRQGHLGFLLAWLQAKGGRDARMQAAESAERLSVAANLDPKLEREELQQYVEMYDEARTSKDTGQLERARKRIHKVLAEELARRVDLTVNAIRAIAIDKRRENNGLVVLVKESLTEHRLQYRRIERRIDDKDDGPAFTPSPETDRYPAAAASRYYVHEASQEQLETLLVHDDRELQAQLVSSGQAISGIIREVRDEGHGRKRIPIWIVESDGDLPLRFREDSAVCVVGVPNRQLRIRSIEKTQGQKYRFELEVTHGKRQRNDNGRTVPAAESKLLKRERVVLVKPSMDQIARRKSYLIWKKDTPGAWLTHEVPRVHDADLPDDVGENLDEMRGTK